MAAGQMRLRIEDGIHNYAVPASLMNFTVPSAVKFTVLGVVKFSPVAGTPPAFPMTPRR
jgi:hypothetical protein